jgi:exonuclease-1
MLLKTCILNGCDYLESVKGVGFKKALRLVKENCGDIKAIIAQLHSEKFKVSDYYLHDFQRAFYTFKHQVIFDTDTKRQRYL